MCLIGLKKVSTPDVLIFIPFKNSVELKKVGVEVRLNPTYFSHTILYLSYQIDV